MSTEEGGSSSRKIKIGVVGYGNLGRGVELAISQSSDIELVAVFTRRAPQSIESQAKVVPIQNFTQYKDQIDVMILCGGSAKDLPEQVTEISSHFHTVDSYDNHGEIPNYFAKVDQNSKAHNTLSLISTGWDPGLFSIARLLEESILPNGTVHTFWGKGVSQGHSDAIRRVKGVKNGIQYTVPNEDVLAKVRSGGSTTLSSADKHRRVCYVVAQEQADLTAIEKEIKTMPGYFEPYETEVHFISEEELKKNHSKMPHGGVVTCTGASSGETKHRIEFSLNLDSNPEFTSNVLVAYARAVYRMAKEGKRGAISVFDVPLGLLSPKSAADLRKTIL